MDRHSTNWFEGWLSCEASMNPNPVRGESHWIMYDLGDAYKLGASHFWNHNDPAHLSNGIRDYTIEHSMDGIEWELLGEFVMPMANGLPIYEGFMGPDFDEVVAQYVLITASSNHGGSCFGFSEIKVDREKVVTSDKELDPNQCLSVQVYPNPFVSKFTAQIASDCPGQVSYSLKNLLGQTLLSGELPAVPGGRALDLNTEGMPSGSYILHLNQGSKSVSMKLTKVTSGP